MDGPFPGGMPPAASGASVPRLPRRPAGRADGRNTGAWGLVGRRVPGAHGIARTGAWLRPAGHLR
ncbi:MAG: hypothetical protein QOH43_2925 [Solirubrobacteraceae bacterium]|jgi:hypothetical protein|nr:hypothetical protein [Solirubrobacteraceae bacterium]